jgi:hypothetical protein
VTQDGLDTCLGLGMTYDECSGCGGAQDGNGFGRVAPRGGMAVSHDDDVNDSMWHDTLQAELSGFE